MLSESIEASQKRAWLHGGIRTNVLVRLFDSAARVPVAALFEELLKASPNCLLVLQQAEIRDQNGSPVHIVKNLRGRPKESFTTSSRGKAGEELFFSSGVIRSVPSSKNTFQQDSRNGAQPQVSDASDDIPFEFEVRSEFSQFIPKAVEHRLVGNSSQVIRPIIDEFEIQLLPRLVPAEVHDIRFGVEYFRQTLFGGLASFSAPTVYQRFYLEITRSMIEIRIEEDFGGQFKRLPQFEGNLIKPLDYALDTLELYVGLERRILSSLS